ncbi:hypothetical protein [Stenotrophomonas lactitubi]|uniref:hypothetical protein n=1 Tax=Stenotrophomonas lactitubi TaxID=2045214 RepID=UPI003876B673
MRQMSGALFSTMVLVAGLTTSACAKSPVPEPSKESAMSENLLVGETRNGHTYTNAPVEAKLGPYRFMIPANYYDDQMGPPWDGIGLLLHLQWPSMEPEFPGIRSRQNFDATMRRFNISIDYIEPSRERIEDVLPRYAELDTATGPNAPELRDPRYALERRDPSERLDLRIAQPEWMGLTPYAIDEPRMQEYSVEYAKKYGKPAPRNPAYEDEWYVARNPDGSLATLIKCDSHKYRPKDGLIIEGDHILNDENSPTTAGCRHSFVDRERNLTFNMNYARVLLKDWKKMEDAARAIPPRYQVK